MLKNTQDDEFVMNLVELALARPPEEREGCLRTACGENPSLFQEVWKYVVAEERMNGFLLEPICTVPSAEHHFEHGEVLDGRFRIVREIAEGGMGVVWLAERAYAGNLVAIKFLPHAELSPARRERFAREIKTLAKLKHSFIARLYDAGTLDEGTPWFVMEYVEGVPFTEYCRAQGRTVDEQLRLFRSVCEAVRLPGIIEIANQ